MNQDDFTAARRAEGFTEFATVERKPNATMDWHAHPFDAHVLVLEGELRLSVGDDERDYRTGDAFYVPRGVEHRERYGPAGIRYLAARRR